MSFFKFFATSSVLVLSLAAAPVMAVEKAHAPAEKMEAKDASHGTKEAHEDHHKHGKDCPKHKKHHGSPDGMKGDHKKHGKDCKKHKKHHNAAKSSSGHSMHHWDYSAEHGAAKWGNIAKDFHACKDGKQQSPIDIAKYKQVDLPEIEFSYSDAPLMLTNNGHTVQVNMPAGSSVKVGDQVYDLLHFNFHTPSEHYLDGVPFPMEVHFVHKGADGALGVIGVMFKVGRANNTVAKIWENIPGAGETVSPKGVTFSPLDLLPAGGEYYAYSGSLTTPPCSEGVSWHVMKQPIEISEDQLRAFQALFPVNARPVQPLGNRVVSGD